MLKEDNQPTVSNATNHHQAVSQLQLQLQKPIDNTQSTDPYPARSIFEPRNQLTTRKYNSSHGLESDEEESDEYEPYKAQGVQKTRGRPRGAKRQGQGLSNI
jgi:hypothetical protein